MSVARKELNWEKQVELSIDPERSRQVRSQHPPSGSACSMCGEFCALEMMEKYLNTPVSKSGC